MHLQKAFSQIIFLSLWLCSNAPNCKKLLIFVLNKKKWIVKREKKKNLMFIY